MGAHGTKDSITVCWKKGYNLSLLNKTLISWVFLMLHYILLLPLTSFVQAKSHYMLIKTHRYIKKELLKYSYKKTENVFSMKNHSLE